MSRQHTMMGILLLCLGNGFISPLVIIAYMWAPFWFPSIIPMKQEYHLIGSTMIVGVLSILISGVPAALFERITGRQESDSTSLYVWLGSAVLITLPGLLRFI
ncbi:MAG: hypothetical protein HQL44_16235 [Alphaproteobacteria bacterium]|nr:hypothetical protein [Alphaproteobacteria bacterium]